MARALPLPVTSNPEKPRLGLFWKRPGSEGPFGGGPQLPFLGHLKQDDPVGFLFAKLFQIALSGIVTGFTTFSVYHSLGADIFTQPFFFPLTI